MKKFFDQQKVPFITGVVFTVVRKGPRLETAAEIQRMQKEGCDIVGMTVMPEAALARELDLEYLSLSLVINWAAGIVQDTITTQAAIQVAREGMLKVQAQFSAFLCFFEKKL